MAKIRVAFVATNCDHKLDRDSICRNCFRPFRRVSQHIYAEIVRTTRKLNHRQTAAVLYRRYLAVR